MVLGKCNQPWMVQIFENGAFYFFETQVQADDFVKSLDGVHMGPVYDPEEGIANERLVLEMTTLIIENESSERNS